MFSLLLPAIHQQSFIKAFLLLLIRGSLVQAHPEAPKKESCKSMAYRIFLFLMFQICSQKFHSICYCNHSLAELTPKGFCKRLSFHPLSSSNVLALQAAKPSGQVENLYGISTVNGYIST